MRFEVPAALDGQRLDRALAILTGLSRAAVRRLLDADAVTVGGEQAGAVSTRVRTGAEVEVDATALADAEQRLRAPSAPVAVGGIEFAVVHEDEHVVVVAKPAGLVTHPGAGHTDDTLLNGLVHRYPDIASAGPVERPGIVHRLDRGTSGLLVCARTPAAREHLIAQLAARTVVRDYVTLVRGTPDAARGTIDAPIGRSRRNRTKMEVVADGREARTDYAVLGSGRAGAGPGAGPGEAADPDRAADQGGGTRVSLLHCRLQTGRTHQIRVHLAEIGLPVLGDAVYGCPDPFGGDRSLLHALVLRFEHPATGAPVHCVDPPPADFAAAVEALGLSAEVSRLTAPAESAGDGSTSP
ncbi:MAG TPA: RluA family pseudouridine synthase [Acidimicrobiaceae bacterium]|nr:RluA family pseudouridine synthase [Acidimicrobiaceae bacterium]